MTNDFFEEKRYGLTRLSTLCMVEQETREGWKCVGAVLLVKSYKIKYLDG